MCRCGVKPTRLFFATEPRRKLHHQNGNGKRQRHGGNGGETERRGSCRTKPENKTMQECFFWENANFLYFFLQKLAENGKTLVINKAKVIRGFYMTNRDCKEVWLALGSCLVVVLWIALKCIFYYLPIIAWQHIREAF